jgi:hypothetical protein
MHCRTLLFHSGHEVIIIESASLPIVSNKRGLFAQDSSSRNQYRCNFVEALMRSFALSHLRIIIFSHLYQSSDVQNTDVQYTIPNAWQTLTR